METLNIQTFKDKVFDFENNKEWTYKGSRPAIIDFYADWCVACKEMDRFTFHDPKVIEQLGNLTLLQVDVTANSADDRALMKRFGLFGPPGMIFFDTKGQEIAESRIVGVMEAGAFFDHVSKFITNP